MKHAGNAGEGAQRALSPDREVSSAPMGVAEAEQAADAAALAFPAWAALPGAQRIAMLVRAADRLHHHGAELADLAGRELGVTPDWVAFNLTLAQRMLMQASTLVDTGCDGPACGAPEGMRYHLRRRPAGVVLGIAPWNAPVTLAVRAVAAPLALGNTVVLKGSELCPATHALVAQALREGGLPEGVLGFVSNAPDQGHDVAEALIAHPAVRRVNFTGSTRVGRQLALSCARHLKRNLLELSGKGAMLVLGDADIPAAARVAAHATFLNQGQICMSTDRVIVVDAVAEAFVAAFRAEAERLRAGQGGAPLGRLIGREAATRLRGLIADAVSKGAELVTGGEALADLVQPTLLDHVAFGMRLYEEEVFGPIAGIVRVADVDEAVSVANDSAFALSVSVIGGDMAQARAVAQRLEAGVVHVNGSTVYDDPNMPFGGLKDSGYGRFGGHAAIEEFTELQWLTERDVPQAERLGEGSPRP
ncbi:aldehyde dehydrogenase family protein [Allosediminivita pacifica]|uniref:Acyl-CoA reductase-like NAD-dependent aldehyde dehydrogenase n=1 Tax=Allosediminivita pacifica TaxID=1267769 RepID=A0A2T6AW74_9RHOB|nr:aldehyde dehydrogenase family protein [Allosediminivita pacifica]PTX48068.1 acyl-CoA reductase-like NAD-dependent aldehyde dehydrogenase [Allosediminivita pacifica]GGB11961.1 salicylaldehyde dehydrogenase [Allosediminivita pacifica]